MKEELKFECIYQKPSQSDRISKCHVQKLHSTLEICTMLNICKGGGGKEGNGPTQFPSFIMSTKLLVKKQK